MSPTKVNETLRGNSIMKQFIKSKILWLSFFLFTMGTAIGGIENTYYQYIDENVALVES